MTAVPDIFTTILAREPVCAASECDSVPRRFGEVHRANHRRIERTRVKADIGEGSYPITTYTICIRSKHKIVGIGQVRTRK